jgi:hypothetical protein
MNLLFPFGENIIAINIIVYEAKGAKPIQYASNKIEEIHYIETDLAIYDDNPDVEMFGIIWMADYSWFERWSGGGQWKKFKKPT